MLRPSGEERLRISATCSSPFSGPRGGADLNFAERRGGEGVENLPNHALFSEVVMDNLRLLMGRWNVVMALM